MPTLEFHTLDVFTDRPFAGNPLAVVLGAGGLGTAQMQAIAREFNLSETIFVMPPADPAHSAKVRIFFPTAEIPFAGHPTIGCAVLLACRDRPEGDFTATITLEEEAGLVPVAVTRRGGICEGEFTAPRAPVPHPGGAPVALVARALGLDAGEIGCGRHAPALWQGGPAFLFVPLASRAALARARPIEPHWSDLMRAGGVDSAWLYTPCGAGQDFRARMFSPTAGIPEDPATGSAAALFAAQLHAAGDLPGGTHRFTLLQGAEMGRPSRLRLTAEVRGGALGPIRVAGAAAPVSEGRIAVP